MNVLEDERLLTMVVSSATLVAMMRNNQPLLSVIQKLPYLTFHSLLVLEVASFDALR